MADQLDVAASGRNRSYTWHGSQNWASDSEKSQVLEDDVSVTSETTSSAKKPWSRRNAWGNMSYADLITKAIESTPEKRMTLAQIYNWMVENVPYFHDKGGTNSSSGWKNSIRHNLSLRRRFKRVSNDDTAKSSWWMVNDDASSLSLGRRKQPSVKQLMTDKQVPSGEKSPGFVRAAEYGNFPHAGSDSYINFGSLLYKVNDSAASQFSESSMKQLMSNVSGESMVDNAVQLGQMTWATFGSEHFPSLGNGEHSVETDGGALAYPMPLMPISEIFEPVERSASSDVQLVELKSSAVYGDYNLQTTAGQGEPVATRSGLSTMPFHSPSLFLPSSSQVICRSSSSAVDVGHPNSSQGGPQQQLPGWSLLRQMLTQSHHENTRMNGLAGVQDGRWIQSSEDVKPVAEFSGNAMKTEAVDFVDVGAELSDVLPSENVLTIEPLEESYITRWDDFKCGDAWNVNLNMVLGVHDKLPYVDNNNTTSRMFESEFN